MGAWNDRFGEAFADLTARMLRALERRAARARERAAMLSDSRLGREPTGNEALERKRWLELEQDYRRAYDGVHGARVHVHYATALLDRMRREAEGPDEPPSPN